MEVWGDWGWDPRARVTALQAEPWEARGSCVCS